jgi:hypothetical protein
MKLPFLMSLFVYLKNVFKSTKKTGFTHFNCEKLKKMQKVEQMFSLNFPSFKKENMLFLREQSSLFLYF